MSFWERLTRVTFFSVAGATDLDRDYKGDSYTVRFDTVEEDSIIEARLEGVKEAEVESAEIISAGAICYIALVLYLYIRVAGAARAAEIGVSD